MQPRCLQPAGVALAVGPSEHLQLLCSAKVRICQMGVGQLGVSECRVSPAPRRALPAKSVNACHQCLQWLPCLRTLRNGPLLFWEQACTIVLNAASGRYSLHVCPSCCNAQSAPPVRTRWITAGQHSSGVVPDDTCSPAVASCSLHTTTRCSLDRAHLAPNLAALAFTSATPGVSRRNFVARSTHY